MSAAVAYEPNRYSCVQMNTASLNYAHIKGSVFIVKRCTVTLYHF